MAVLGFRRPQFSEEAAWLPEWLQSSQTTAFDKFTNESEIKVSEEKSAEREASEDGRYNECHLFLPGSDKSASSLASPTASVLHLSLYLSSDGTLQSTQSLSLDNYQVETSKPSSPQSEKIRMPVEVRQNIKVFNSPGILDPAGLRATPTTMGNPEFVHKSPFREEKQKKRIKYTPCKYGNFDHAVELSIAASETLLIHELLETSKASAEASALLDISLKVKQARLLRVEEDSSFTDQQDESCEYLSDLDDSAMADAFVDVGLCTTSSGDYNLSHATVSHVNESHQHDLEASCNLGRSEVPNPEEVLSLASIKNSQENWNIDREVKFVNAEYPILNCDIGGLECFGSGQSNVKFQTTKLQAGLKMPKLDSLSTQPQLAVNSYQPQDHNVPEDILLKQPPSGVLNSCWLGVWTRKDDFPGLILDSRKCTAKALAVETSSLSESVNVPDMSSYVDRQKSEHLTSSQACTSGSVVPLANLVEDEPLISPEIAKLSSSLSVDPLCSFVPCSYRSETSQSVHNGHIFQIGGEYINESEPCPASKLEPDRLNLTLEQTVKVHCATSMNEEGSDLEVHKQLDSLNNHSVVLLSRLGTVPISNEQLLLQSINNKESCYSKTNKNTYSACGNAITTAPYFKPTSTANPSSKGLPPIGNLTEDVIVCNNNAEGRAGFLTSLPEQQHSVFNMKGTDLLQASEGLCLDKKLNCTASQRVLDDFSLRKKSHAYKNGVEPCIQVLQRKRVHFKEDTSELEQIKSIHLKKQKTGSEFVSNLKSKMLQTSNQGPDRETFSQEVKKKLTNYSPFSGDKLIFRGLEFLLTGLPKKRVKEVEQLIIRYGGIVIFDIPSPGSKGKIRVESEFQKLPVILCLKKVETTKFLYGCAVKACILKVDWLLDSVSAGSVLQPEKYMIFSNQNVNHAILRSPLFSKLVFEGVGVVFHGKHRFCTRLSNIFKYGGGQVFKALQRLVQSCERKKLTIQVVVAEDRSIVSRHLKHCATENNIPIVSSTWIRHSLLSGKLLPFTENDYHVPKLTRKASREMLPLSTCLSQEI